MPDRWKIPYPEDARRVEGRILDPYNQNVLKGDRPIAGDSIFLVVGATLEAPAEQRRVPAASGVSTERPDSSEFFGNGGQTFVAPEALVSVEVFKGQTAFRPKSWAAKAAGAFNLNYLRTGERNIVDIDVREGRTRRRHDVALESAYAEIKLADLSPAYDFVSLRAGIQPFVSDARGFVFADQNLGARVFGSLGANRWQYNLAAFEMLEKETNSELNTLERRQQRVFLANAYRQDSLAPGHTLTASVVASRDAATTHYDLDGFLVRPARIGSVRPHAVRPIYLGVGGDGHFGRWNVSHAFYQVLGTDTLHPLAGRSQRIRANMAALEVSQDRAWLRLRGSLFWASGDGNPSDDRATGFDSVYDSARFAGGPFSFWQRSAIPLTQTGVLLKPAGGLLPSLRSSRYEGQANFVNPGLLLGGVSADARLTQQLELSATANYLRFHETGALELLLLQPKIGKAIGVDLGLGATWRPLLNDNVVLTLGGTALVPGRGLDDIYSSACGVPGCGAAARTLFNAFVSLRLTY